MCGAFTSRSDLRHAAQLPRIDNFVPNLWKKWGAAATPRFNNKIICNTMAGLELRSAALICPNLASPLQKSRDAVLMRLKLAICRLIEQAQVKKPPSRA